MGNRKRSRLIGIIVGEGAISAQAGILEQLIMGLAEGTGQRQVYSQILYWLHRRGNVDVLLKSLLELGVEQGIPRHTPLGCLSFQPGPIRLIPVDEIKSRGLIITVHSQESGAVHITRKNGPRTLGI